MGPVGKDTNKLLSTYTENFIEIYRTIWQHCDFLPLRREHRVSACKTQGRPARSARLRGMVEIAYPPGARLVARSPGRIVLVSAYTTPPAALRGLRRNVTSCEGLPDFQPEAVTHTGVNLGLRSLVLYV